LSVSVLNTVLETRRAILSNDLQSDSRFDASQSIMSGWLRSVMCVPICRADGSVLGVVQLDATARGRGEFRGRDLEVLAGIAGAAAQAVEQALAHDERLHQAKLNRDLELAGDVQKALLPSKPPEIPGYEVFDFYEPARHVGGDYFNYVPLPDGRIAVVMADVSGKGVPAAMVMAVLSGDVKYCLAAEPDLVRAVTRINDSVCRSGWDERFATFVAAVLDPRTHRATLVNAGHLPAYVRDSEGGVTAIGPEQGGLPLGLAAEWEYRASEISIEPGMTLVFFTDGISEAMDVEDRLYGLERIEAQVGKPGGSPEEVGRRILADVERHTAGQIRSDDMCLVCVGRVLGNEDSRGSSLSLRPAGKTPRRSSRKPSGPGNR
jgi:serine phosphatase RsbU (regulator of sigma subunit)